MQATINAGRIISWFSAEVAPQKPLIVGQGHDLALGRDLHLI
jgi:hypothetical protein